jgi:methylated-DNA-protein-cysteine methyltransferase-like protein
VPDRPLRERFDERVARAVRAIPPGRVASYRQIAALAGSPLAARQVSGTLRRVEGLPWWRVLGADGSIRIMRPDLRREQATRLAREGVVVDEAGRVDLARFGWRDGVGSRARRAASSTRRRAPP